MEKILSDFGVQPILLLAQIVNFLVLLFILQKLLYKPLLNVLETRKKRIEESLANVEEIKQRLEKTAEEEERRILEAAHEGEKIIKEAQEAAVGLIEDGRKRGEELYQQILDEAHVQNMADKEKMMQEVKSELSSIVMVALEKVMGQAIDKSKQKEMVDDVVKKI